MDLRKRNILLISPEPWNHIFVSKHHYATHLAERENRVFFLGPPTAHGAVASTDFKNVYSVAYSGFPKGMRFYPSFLQRFFIRKKFESLQELCDIQFDIIWSFDNSVFFDFSALPGDILKISHIVDLNQDFQTRKAATTADYCFCTTELIKERLLKYNTKVFKINHGFYDPAIDSSPVTLPGKSKIKALYTGNLAIPFIDWVLLDKVVMENPEVDFIFVGPNAEIFNQDSEQNQAKKNVLKCDNAFFVGRMNSNELIKYQRSADILLVVYQEKYHNNQANPHKMMEYLGSGKLVVATFTAEYKDLHERKIILMSMRNSELLLLFKKSLRELSTWNGEEKQAVRRNFALDNAYDKQISRIEEIIYDKKGYSKSN
jgi:hypothetical protein